MEQDKKFALLIDAENISPQYIDIILSEANNLGNVIYKRIYGNWTSPQMGSWKSTILDNAIQPVQQYSNTSGKNSSDSASSLIRWICFTEPSLMDSALSHQTATLRAWHPACVNRISMS